MCAPEARNAKTAVRESTARPGWRYHLRSAIYHIGQPLERSAFWTTHAHQFSYKFQLFIGIFRQVLHFYYLLFYISRLQ